ncbi:mannitol dehydrogenase family protein [Jannaschia sp. 2305UL9-9]|uniref:mannitol dehydrogenase family protein n=1 Tax=Jannaschia sp. 2305UL9-9 TaxID=3121638 RepID=UPI003528512E
MTTGDIIPLSLANLDALPAQVARPGYDRDDLTAGIVHIGVGNFHRAHMAVYLDQLFGTGKDHDWALLGAGVRPGDAAMRDRLKAQDCLSTVVDLDPAGASARITAPMIDFLPVDAAVLVDALSKPSIRIASLTITEGGYYIDPLTNSFDTKHADIVADAANPDAPRTVFGILLAALRARRAAGTPPFTVLSCDNIPHNGNVTRGALVGLAAMSDPDLAAWIEAEVALPNGMVDCITPATGPAEIARVHALGIDDKAPVTCEPFRQWVLEDTFPQGRPALEDVGVEFVEDVLPYELMKLRLLNGLHAAMGYAGDLSGHGVVHDAVRDPVIRSWMLGIARREIAPTLAPIPGVDYDAYLLKLLERFGNDAVRDTIPRLCFDGSNRQPKFIVPTLRDCLAAGGDARGLLLEVALWREHVRTSDTFADPNADTVRKAAMGDPVTFLQMTEVFGDLAQNAVAVAGFEEACARIASDGPRGAMIHDAERD